MLQVDTVRKIIDEKIKTPKFQKWARDLLPDKYMFVDTGKERKGHCTACGKIVDLSRCKTNINTYGVCPDCGTIVMFKSNRAHKYKYNCITKAELAFVYRGHLIVANINIARLYEGCGYYVSGRNNNLPEKVNTIIYPAEVFVWSNIRQKFECERFEKIKLYESYSGDLKKTFKYSSFYKTEKMPCSGFEHLPMNNLFHIDLNEKIQTTPFKYTWEICKEIHGKNPYIDYPKILDSFYRYPFLEQLYKAGYQDAVYEKIKTGTLRGINYNKKGIDVLGLNRNELRDVDTLIERGQSKFSTILYFYKRFKKSGINIADDFFLPFTKGFFKSYDKDKVIHLLENDVSNFKNAVRYLNKQCRKAIEEKSGCSKGAVTEEYKCEKVIHAYVDYINASKQIGTTYEEFPPDCIRAHDQLMEYMRRENERKIAEANKKEVAYINENIMARFESLCKQLKYEAEDYFIEPMASFEEMQFEGSEQKICVGTLQFGYPKKYADGKCIILKLRKVSDPSRPLATVEVTPSGKILQSRAYANGPLDSECIEFLEKFKKAKLCHKINMAIPEQKGITK